jgi:hypothetical protein
MLRFVCSILQGNTNHAGATGARDEKEIRLPKSTDKERLIAAHSIREEPALNKM